MKKNIICALFLLTLTAAFAGCVQSPSPQGSGSTEGSSYGADNQDLTAEYFYLKSRLYTNKGQMDLAAAALETAIEKDGSSSFLKRELIRLYHRQKRVDEATRMATKLVQQDPDNVDNLMLLVQLKKGDENKEALSDLLKQILKLDPENKETYLRLGKIHMDSQNFDNALDLFTRMTKVFPDYYVAHFYLGEALLMTDKEVQAEAEFLKTIELEPELVEPRFRLIAIYQKKNPKKNQDKIIATYEKILEIEPENDRALLEMALFHYKSNDLKKSEPLFAQLSQKAKESARLVMTAVDTFITKRRYNDAIIVFSQLRKSDPGNTNLNFFLGMAHEALEDTDKAIEYYLKVTPDHPQYKKTILSIAFLYRDINKDQEALRFLEQHHKQSPADIDIISYLASFYEEQNRYADAMTLLQKGLKNNPENTILLFKLGAIQDKAGLRQDSINTMKSVIRIDPENASALNYLGYTYAEMGIFLDEAQDLVKRALEIKPEDSYITDSLGWIYFQQQDYDKAIFYLEKAAEISKFETIIAAHLADAYVKAGHINKAIAVYKKAIANAKKDQTDLIREIKEKIQALEKESDGDQ